MRKCCLTVVLFQATEAAAAPVASPVASPVRSAASGSRVLKDEFAKVCSSRECD